MVQPVPTNALLHPLKEAAIRMAPRAETCQPLPIAPFLLVQNLSSKWIAATDNMRPKLDVAKRHHRLLTVILTFAE